MKLSKSIQLIILLFAIIACQSNDNLPKVKQNGSFSIYTSEKDEIEIEDFETNLSDKKCKVINISAQNGLSYEIEFL